MLSPDKLLRALERAPVEPFAGFVYRVIAERWRDSPLSTIGSLRAGGRYNAPNTFPVLYCADSQMTAMLEVEALFTTADGQLRGVPRNPDLVLSLRCELTRVLDLTDDRFHSYLGTTYEELASLTPSRFVMNARGEEPPSTAEVSAVISLGNGHIRFAPLKSTRGISIYFRGDVGKIRSMYSLHEMKTTHINTDTGEFTARLTLPATKPDPALQTLGKTIDQSGRTQSLSQDP